MELQKKNSSVFLIITLIFIFTVSAMIFITRYQTAEDSRLFYMNIWLIITVVIGFGLSCGFLFVLNKYFRTKTELKELIVKLQDADERAKLMLDTSPLGITIFTKDFQIIDCNQEVLNMFGEPDKESYKANFHTYEPKYQPSGELSSEVRMKSLKKALESNIRKVEYYHEKPSGDPLPCEVTISKVEHKEYNVLVAHVRDLSELKEMTARVREIDEYSQLFLVSTPVCCLLWDKNKKIVNCNHASLRFFMINSLPELNEKKQYLSPEYQPCGGSSSKMSDEWLDKAFKESYCRFEWMYQTLSGEPLPSEVTLVRLKHKGDFVIAEYTRDLREYKAYLKEIEKARDLAQAANQAKSVFLAKVSHEIRTPMNSIIGFAELAKEDSSAEKLLDYIAKISENAEWLLCIINDILDISKIESGKISIENTPFKLQEIIDQCRSLIMPKAVEKGITLNCYLEQSFDKKLLGDPGKLRQVFVNILSNAVKFTNVGTINFLISVKEVCGNSVTLYFEISDSGIGVSKEQLPEIFEPFKQADDSITRKYGGSGLGLAIAKNIIEMMGGVLNVESTLGIGSKFSFELNFITVNDEELSEKNTGFNDIKRPNFKGEILVCEDNKMNQQVICEHLERVGIKPVIAENGKAGVELTAQRKKDGRKPFDLIFMDIHMPIMGGLEAVAEINKLNTNTPIIAMTANIMYHDIEFYKSKGMYGSLGKPFKARELWECLMKFLPVIGYSQVSLAEQSQSDKKIKEELKLHFFKYNQTKYKEIIKALDNGDVKLAHRLVHSLKSNAGQIGETELQKAAANVEYSLSEKNNKLTYDQRILLKEELNKVLAKLAVLPENNTDSKKNILTEEEKQKLFCKLDEMLINKNPQCINLLDEIKRIPGSENLANQVEDFNFIEAIAALGRLKKSNNTTESK